MHHEPHAWYALYTKSRCEKKVATLLARKQIESYCPMNEVESQWSDRKKIVQEPLFKSYVFVRIPERLINTVRQTEGVVNFVYWLGKPAVITDHEVDMMKRFLDEFKTVQLEQFPIRRNEVTDVPALRQRRLVEVSKRKVKATLHSLGFHMIATLPSAELAFSDSQMDVVDNLFSNS
ncbi:UpxY family transcription antiterminator [Chitinophaga horti]|uniref:UpxY family transcription antiterminator n=1 Tax=Chitinophaga horti TaxID=2920382 RepID=A0ABY6J163_9BACT|nr:UpxY family transcription antiterminator [Chitinophaga horti]UYQ92362.1 UpxY family transcription antiterminator [Chitinophaga horti]